MLAAWLHDLSPFAIRFTDDFGIRWYGLSYALGFLIGWLLLRWLAQRRAVLIPPERAGDAILYAVIGVVVGGRLGYCIFYEPSLFTSFSSSPPWWGLLAINRGGMASHGGMIGVIIASYFIARLGASPANPPTAVGGLPGSGTGAKPAPILHILDALALITPPGLFLGRMANFINGELLGRFYALPGHPAPWWTVRFPQEVEVGRLDLPEDVFNTRHIQIENLLQTNHISGLTFEQQYRNLLDQIQHGRHDLAAQLEPFLSARYPSQIFQGLTEGVVLFIVLWSIARKPRTPGVIGCWFLITYGILRISTEFIRLPDAQLAVQRILGLSRGQWLSVAMIIAGLIGLAVVLRRASPKLGGWGIAARDRVITS